MHRTLILPAFCEAFAALFSAERKILCRPCGTVLLVARVPTDEYESVGYFQKPNHRDRHGPGARDFFAFGSSKVVGNAKQIAVQIFNGELMKP